MGNPSICLIEQVRMHDIDRQIETSYVITEQEIKGGQPKRTMQMVWTDTVIDHAGQLAPSWHQPDHHGHHRDEMWIKHSMEINKVSPFHGEKKFKASLFTSVPRTAKRKIERAKKKKTLSSFSTFDLRTHAHTVQAAAALF